MMRPKYVHPATQEAIALHWCKFWIIPPIHVLTEPFSALGKIGRNVGVVD